MSEDSDGAVNISWSSGSSLPDNVAGLYYRYGLLVATHSAKAIFIAISIFMLCSTPLLYLPLPGYLPQEYVTSMHNYSVPPPAPEGGIQLSPSPMPTPLWYQGPPRTYIQQVIVRSSVSPWHGELTVGESIRGPMSSVFHLSQLVGDYQSANSSSQNLGSECLLVEGVVGKHPSLPRFNCLILSPADLWGRDPQAFRVDSDILKTVNSLKAKHDGDSNIVEILFGLPVKEIAMSSNPRNPQILMYAMTIALKQYSEEFITGLESFLIKKFPLHQPISPSVKTMSHIYFPSRVSPWEFMIIAFYCFLFSSIYFSVLKMKGFHSKLGISVSIMATLVASLCVATGVCAHFGLRPLHSRLKFAYPIISGLVGFENSMIMIRSILTTPDHLDVKIRVAQGLAKEGWMILKYFMTMITIVTLSFFLFIPIVQELCIYAGFILLCDVYLQLLFLTAVIAIDLHRCEPVDHRRNSFVNPLFRYPVHSSPNLILLAQDSDTETCVPNLHRRHHTSNPGEDRIAPPQCRPTYQNDIPKRLQITYFLASKRVIQRFIICSFIGWIAWIIYSSDIVDKFTDPFSGRQTDLTSLIYSLTNRTLSSNVSENVRSIKNEHEDVHTFELNKINDNIVNKNYDTFVSDANSKPKVDIEDLKNQNLNKSEEIKYLNKKFLKYRRQSFYKRLPPTHWPSMFGYYNISLRGHYLTILPPILLSIPIDPEDAKDLHNDMDPHTEKWIPYYNLDDIPDFDSEWHDGSAIIPSSRGELIVTAVLSIPALAVMVYATIALYRCICSRNYAEWRSNWWCKDTIVAEHSLVIGEALPLILNGHSHDVECLATDGSIVVSACLGGEIRAWDPANGECLSTIDRYGVSNKLFYCTRSRTSTECSCGNEREYSLDSSGNSHYPQSPLVLSKSSSSLSNLASQLPDLKPTIDLSFDKNYHPGGDVFRNIHKAYSDFKNQRDNVQYSNNDNLSEKEYSDVPVYKRTYSHKSFCHKRSSEYEHYNQNYPYGRQVSSSYVPEHSHRGRGHSRNLSAGNIPTGGFRFGHGMSHPYSISNPSHMVLGSDFTVPSGPYEKENIHEHCRYGPIWCMACQDGVVFVGTGIGVVEVWDVFSAQLKCFHDDGSSVGITFLKLSGNKIVAARLSGAVDILQLEEDLDNIECPSYTSKGTDPRSGGWTFTMESKLRLVRQKLTRAHQQPISVLECEKTKIITGSYDHTLKVLNISDGSCIFTLHGHCGPITTIALGVPNDDPSESVRLSVDIGSIGSVVVSGAQDGGLCLWDIYTGVCIYSIEAHNSSIVALTCTSSYILSLGQDDRLCVWERFQGHLLNTLILSQMYCSSMVMLTNRLLITTQQGSLTVWDIAAGVPIRHVRLCDQDPTIFIRQLLPVHGSIVCDYGQQLRVVRIPVAEKRD